MSTNLKTTKITLTILFLSVICFLCSAFCYTAYAGVPHLINYQGRLTDKAGKPLAGDHDITFRIYDAEAKDTGNLLWEEIYSSRLQGSSSLTIEKGIFSTSLGRLNNGNGQKRELKDLAFDKPYWLEIKVGADEPMTPRQRITSAGYAIRAEKADQAANSDTVSNVGVSVTPAANKLLPLDSNAKLPMGVLKVYDSGWFTVSNASTYIKTHNLGTTKVLMMVYLSDQSDGSGKCVYGLWAGGTGDINWAFSLVSLSTTQVIFRTGVMGIYYAIGDTSGNAWGPSSGYARVIMLALS